MKNIDQDFSKPFNVYFDLLKTGFSDSKIHTRRMLSQMAGMFSDDAAYSEMLKHGDIPVYDFYESGAPSHPGDLAFGTSVVYPGKVGNEYFMTKGHFHSILETAEVYLCLSGRGYMLLENPEGKWDVQELVTGKVAYCSKRYAHRSINTGDKPLITFFVFRGDAGHDYGTIETQGYRKLIIDVNGKSAVVDNPRWKNTTKRK
jgi:glucose-6-phosphate isomerase